MNAVEKILHYCHTIPQEYTPPGYPAPGDTWPDQGGLVFLLLNIILLYI